MLVLRHRLSCKLVLCRLQYWLLCWLLTFRRWSSVKPKNVNLFYLAQKEFSVTTCLKPWSLPEIFIKRVFSLCTSPPRLHCYLFSVEKCSYYNFSIKSSLYREKSLHSKTIVCANTFAFVKLKPSHKLSQNTCLLRMLRFTTTPGIFMAIYHLMLVPWN